MGELRPSSSLGIELDAPATRAKALTLYTGALSRIENPLPRAKVRGWHSLSCSLIQIRQTILRRPIRTSKYVETPVDGLKGRTLQKRR